MKSFTIKPIALPNKPNWFYRDYYDLVIYAVIGAIIFSLLLAFILFLQLYSQPLPSFTAVAPDGKKLELTAFDEPNLTSSTIIRWSKQAAVIAYTFDFVNYNQQLEKIRPYFTAAGWQDYLSSTNPLISTIRDKKLFINSVVLKPPVISNQGPLPPQEYVWRMQIPFLVTYQSAEAVNQQKFTVTLSIVKVPTRVNPAGIGVDQFVMK
jgi:intracellular multiplication protein IcmL